MRIVLALPAVVQRIPFLQAAHQFPMTIEFGVRELPVQLLHQLSEGSLLLRGACVLGCFAILGTTPNVTHTYAVSVVATLGTVGTRLLDGPTLVDGTIQFYHIVISDVAPVVRR